MRTLLGTVDGVVDTQQLNGKTYLVVPVVAIVEGVLHAGNAKYPELALASAFGKIPDSWNGRPVVVDHPVGKDGQSISASNPDVLAQYYLGMIMNANRDDKKLRLEAWIDLDVPTIRDAVVTTMLSRIASQEIIEVSIGAYVFTHEATGTFNGKDYSAVWDVVIPDHLAFLSAQIGACSVEDGCGAFRTDSRRTFSDHALSVLKHYEDKTMTCKCQQNETDNKAPVETSATGGEVTAAQERDVAGVLARICLANGLYDKDVRALLGHALRAENTDSYLIVFSDTDVIYETYEPDAGYVFIQRGYSIDGSNKVTLADDGKKVLFQTKVVTLTGEQTEDDPGERDPGEEVKGETEVTEKSEDTVSINRSASVDEALKAFENTEFGKRIEQALVVEQGIRDDYVERILAAPANKLSKVQLAGMETSVLASIAELATAGKAEADTSAEPAPAAPAAPVINSGRSGGSARPAGNKAPEAPTVFTEDFLAQKRRVKAA